MLHHVITRIFSASDSKSEYKAMVRTLNRENKSSKLKSEIINEFLLEHVCKKLSNTKEIDVIRTVSYFLLLYYYCQRQSFLIFRNFKIHRNKKK